MVMGRSKIFLVTILTLLANLHSWQSPLPVEVGVSYPEDLSSLQATRTIYPSLPQQFITKPQAFATYTQTGSRWLKLSVSSYGKSLGIHTQNCKPGEQDDPSLIEKASAWGEKKLNLGKTKLASIMDN